MVQYNWTNVSKVIKAEVNTLQNELVNLLARQLQGLYLHGSLALGGFQPVRSDIDIIAIITGDVDDELKDRLTEIFLQVSNRPRPMDIYLLTEKALFPFRPPISFELHCTEQLRYTLLHETHAGTRHIDSDLTIFLTLLHRAGIVLMGKPVEKTIPPIPETAFRDALARAVHSAQARLPQDPGAFVLNACRAIAYLQDDAILSKDAGGEWGLVHIPEQFHALIQQALALYRSEQLKRPLGSAVLNAFSDYVTDKVQLMPGTIF